MDVIVERAAGLDVHQASIVACVLIGGGCFLVGLVSPRGSSGRVLLMIVGFSLKLIGLSVVFRRRAKPVSRR